MYSNYRIVPYLFQVLAIDKETHKALCTANNIKELEIKMSYLQLAYEEGTKHGVELEQKRIRHLLKI